MVAIYMIGDTIYAKDDCHTMKKKEVNVLGAG